MTTPRIVSLILAIAFIALTLVTFLSPASTQGLDSAVAAFMVQFQTFGWIQAFLILTALGGATGVIVIALGAAYLLRAHPHLINRLAFVLIGTTIVANVVKVLVSRARPEVLLWFDPLLTYSFPSGHATSSMALFGSLAVIAWRLLTGVKRMLAVSACALVILSVGLSRLVLGAHFLSDVIGGYLLGGAVVVIAFFAWRR